MQGYITKTAMEEYGHIVILRMLDLLDDTVLINKSVLSVCFSFFFFFLRIFLEFFLFSYFFRI